MQVNRNRKGLAAIVLALVAAAVIAPSAPGKVSEGTQIVDGPHMALVANAARRGRIVDGPHMALVANAERHGLTVAPSRPIGSRHFFVGSRGNIGPRVSGGTTATWTSPAALAGLSVAFAFALGGLGVASWRRLGKSRPVAA